VCAQRLAHLQKIVVLAAAWCGETLCAITPTGTQMKKVNTSPVRLDSAHTALWYLRNKTSVKYPEWRDVVLSFLVSLYEAAVTNYALRIQLQRVDGLYVFHQSNRRREKMAFYAHIYQQHLLLHISRDCLLWNHKTLRAFSTPHTGSWERMFKLHSEKELNALLRYVRSLSRITYRQYYASRSIPAKVQEVVWDRDRGRCRSCGSIKDLQFDHIVPFSKGGSSKTPDNVQLLCAVCNLRKSNRRFL
jgi:hypothetical protein